jgi:hypothetical protein
MDPTRAREILRSLAEGINPQTGIAFPPDSPYQQADTVRALYMALEAMGKGSMPRKPRELDPDRPKIGAAWTTEEEQQLRDAFQAGKGISEIAAAHGRTRGAITARLVKLGLIEETVITRAGRGHAPDAGRSRPSIVEPDTTSSPPTATPPPDLTQAEKDSLPF